MSRFGRYELLRPLGRGGMAEVFLARYSGPEGFEKRLVIKRVLPRLSDDRRLLRMFFEEARTHVSLSHGNLVSVFDFGRVGNDYFIAMEHVRGVDLGTLLASERAAGRKLSPALVAYIGIELCRGLGYVHRRGLVHRDVSPRNVLLSVDGEVKLSDFGLVQATREGDDAAAVIGTPAYMAPEQARGERVDARGDLFSLGLVLAEQLLGQRPRDVEGSEATLAMARTGAPPRVVGPMGAVIERATRAEVGERWAGADEMLAALEAEAATLGQGREASVREVARLVGALAPPVEEVAADAGAGKPAVSGLDATLPGQPKTMDLRGGDGGGGQTGAATYFRDHKGKSFVDDVLAGAPEGPATRARTKRLGWILGGAVAVVSVLVGGLVWRVAGSERGREGEWGSPTPTPTQTPTTNPDADPREPVPEPVPDSGPSPTDTASPTPSPTPTPTRSPKPVAETGTLIIKCTPWCVPYVDGKPRGQDGRHHTLTLSAGEHHIEVRRLDDKQGKKVRVGSAPRTLEFTFE